jgi:hypothetical protein
MAKFYGVVGYVETEESKTSPGVWSDVATEHKYKGDVIRDTRRWENGKSLNENLVISNQISIVADAFAYQNFSTMRYVKWMGVAWKITTVEVQRPRLILTLGGVHNGPKN